MISKVKKGLLTGGTIAGIVYGMAAISLTIYLIIVVSVELKSFGQVGVLDNVAEKVHYTNLITSLILYGIKIVSYILIVAMSIKTLVDINKKQKVVNFYTQVITIVSAFGVDAILSMLNSIFFTRVPNAEIVFIVFAVAFLVYFITTICVHGGKNQPAIQTIPTETFGCDLNDPTGKKIYHIRKLNADGIINDDEMKQIIKAILKEDTN